MLHIDSHGPSTTHPGQSTLVDLLRQKALREGDQLAYTFLINGEAEKIDLTYGELDKRCSAIAASLQLAGAAGECVLLLYPPSLEFIVAFMGCLYAEAIAVPAYPLKLNRSHLRIQGIIEDSQASVVLTTRASLAEMERVFSETPYMKNLRWLTTDDIADEVEMKWSEPRISGDTLAMLQYTSGSTSSPKGVMLSHSNLMSNERMLQQAFRLTQNSVFVGWLPLYHDMGLIGIILYSLFLGARSVIMPPNAFLQKPSRWLRAISEYKGIFSGGPNFAYDLCIRRVGPEERSRLDLSSWSIAFNGAEPISHETLERFATTFASCGFRQESFYPCYGLAEGTLFVSGGEKDKLPVIKTFLAVALENNRAIPTSREQEGGRHLIGCGNNLPNQRIAIVEPKSLIECSTGEIGEIWVSGPNVAQGYWRHPQETKEMFQAYLPQTGEGPFLRTGDLGVMLEGELFVTGRLKDLVIIDGRNHYPQDIELTVEKCHHAIRSGCCAAFSINLGGRERLVIAVELERHYRNLDHHELVRAIRQAVAKQHDVRVEHVSFLKIGGVPKTSSGKIQRHACRANFLSEVANKYLSEIKGNSALRG
jgi:acyl-CoA synthetase (AMP-forming)/AMP-acid ligase II